MADVIQQEELVFMEIMLRCKVWSLILWMIAKYENRKRSRSSRRKEKDRFAITYEAQRTINYSSNFISFGTLFCPNNYVDRTWELYNPPHFPEPIKLPHKITRKNILIVF